MNIFVLDNDINICAKYHCDKHVIKMILESAQMLSSVVRLNGHDIGYKLTHQNHPCTIWARKSLSNYLWLFQLTDSLNSEYRYRYSKAKTKTILFKRIVHILLLCFYKNKLFSTCSVVFNAPVDEISLFKRIVRIFLPDP